MVNACFYRRALERIGGRQGMIGYVQRWRDGVRQRHLARREGAGLVRAPQMRVAHQSDVLLLERLMRANELQP